MKDKMPYFNSRALFNGIAMSYIFYTCGSGFWISEILGTILGVIVLIMVKKTNSNHFVRAFVGFVLSLLSVIVLINLGHTLYLRETPVFILAVFPIIGAFIISNSKEIPLKRTVHVLFIYSIFLFLLKIWGLYSHIKIDNLLPIYNLDIKSILWGSITYMSVGIVPVLGLNKIDDKKNIIFDYLVASLTIFTVSFLAASVLGINEVKLYRYPEYVVLKRIGFLNFINNVDSFFNFAIIIDLLFTASQGFKTFNVFDKPFKYFLVATIGILSICICSNSAKLLYVYYLLPIIFIILLFLTIVHKKSKYKTTD